ncbi:MAG TPA: hypothetical protein VG166_00380 [Caulobacteraceae bacterium]|jgi:hypothetical protein|nr:hypothetical protein [Caulobacteraceae bacterium]
MVCRVCGGETVIRGLDFTRHGSVWLFVSVPAACPTSIVTRLVVADSRFAGGPTVDVPNGDLVHIVATGRILDRTFADDTFDGRFAPSKPGTMEALQVDAYNGNETWLRDAFINIPGRPVSDGFGQAASLGHNVFLAEALYLSGMTLAASGDHGELFEFGKSRPGAVPVQMTYRHNVLIAPAAPASNTALLWLGSGDHSGPLDIETLTLDGNVLIAEPYGKKGTTSRIIGMAYAKIARLVAVHNAIWPRGASYCILNEKGDVMRASFKDNINLFNGSKISGFDGYAGTCPGTRR